MLTMRWYLCLELLGSQTGVAVIKSWGGSSHSLAKIACVRPALRKALPLTHLTARRPGSARWIIIDQRAQGDTQQNPACVRTLFLSHELLLGPPRYQAGSCSCAAGVRLFNAATCCSGSLTLKTSEPPYRDTAAALSHGMTLTKLLNEMFIQFGLWPRSCHSAGVFTRAL